MIILSCLMLTKWSSWSPCSADCGEGTTIRTRMYMNSSLKKKCNANLIEHKKCMKTQRCVDEDLMSYNEIKSISFLEVFI